jgi:hypothetical protein
MSWQQLVNNDRVGGSARQNAKIAKRTRSPSSGETRFHDDNNHSNNNNDFEFRQPQQHSNDGSPWQAMKRLRVAEQLREENFTSVNNSQQLFRNVNDNMYPSHPPLHQIESTMQAQKYQQQMERYENVNRVLGDLHQERMLRASGSNTFHSNNTKSMSQSMQHSNHRNNPSNSNFSNGFRESLQREYQHQQAIHDRTDDSTMMSDSGNHMNQQWEKTQMWNENHNEDDVKSIWNHENQQLQRLDRRQNGQSNTNEYYHATGAAQHDHHRLGSSETSASSYDPSQLDYQGRKRKVVRLFTSSNLG